MSTLFDALSQVGRAVTLHKLAVVDSFQFDLTPEANGVRLAFDAGKLAGLVSAYSIIEQLQQPASPIDDAAPMGQERTHP